MTQSIEPLLTLMATLRDPKDGCAWDIKQTLKTLAPYTLEEAYEVVDAIENGTMEELKGELGDLLLQVVFQAQLAKEQGDFDFYDVVQTLSDKLIRRHPHIFTEQANTLSAEDVSQQWQAIKQTEKSAQPTSAMPSNSKLAMPALCAAEAIQDAAAKVGFDWPEVVPVYHKVHEELAEVQAATEREHIEEELGDLLFSVVNLARHLKVEPETALRKANAKFVKRFVAMEASAVQPFETLSLDEMEALWVAVKSKE